MTYLPTILSLAAASATQIYLPFGERMMIGLEVTIIGLLTVFSALIVIWGVLVLFRIIFERAGKPKPAETEPANLPESSTEDDAAIVAAITAAVAAYEGKSTSSLRVVKFTRK